MIFIQCNWILTWWQWLVNLYKNRKETCIYGGGGHKTIQKHRIHKLESKHTKQENKHENNIKNPSQGIGKKQIAANNNETTYCTEPTYSYVTINQ